MLYLCGATLQYNIRPLIETFSGVALYGGLLLNTCFMKTSVVMKRQIGDLPIYQRTKDGFFNATSLLKSWNNLVSILEASENQEEILHRDNSPYVNLEELKLDYQHLTRKDLKEYLSNKSTHEFIVQIMKEESFESEKQVILKSRASRGENAGTLMHPMLFIDFAMWLNPAFKYKVLKFVQDNMLFYRDKAGDAYREMASELQNIVGKDFIYVAIKRVAIGINHVIFGTHYKQVRDDYGTEDKMNELFDLEHKIAFLIKEGFLKDIEEVMSFLRKKYKQIYLN